MNFRDLCHDRNSNGFFNTANHIWVAHSGHASIESDISRYTLQCHYCNCASRFCNFSLFYVNYIYNTSAQFPSSYSNYGIILKLPIITPPLSIFASPDLTRNSLAEALSSDWWWPFCIFFLLYGCDEFSSQNIFRDSEIPQNLFFLNFYCPRPYTDAESSNHIPTSWISSSSRSCSLPPSSCN